MKDFKNIANREACKTEIKKKQEIIYGENDQRRRSVSIVPKSHDHG